MLWTYKLTGTNNSTLSTGMRLTDIGTIHLWSHLKYTEIHTIYELPYWCQADKCLSPCMHIGASSRHTLVCGPCLSALRLSAICSRQWESVASDARQKRQLVVSWICKFVFSYKIAETLLHNYLVRQHQTVRYETRLIPFEFLDA